MKRTIMTFGFVAAALTASARGSDTILEKDPFGVYVMIVSIVTVLIALVGLCIMIQIFANIMVRSAQKKAAKTRSKGVVVDDVKVPIGCDSVVNGEIIAAIALAVKLNRREVHDHESDVITINKVARVYSPWSSKIHGLTPLPGHK